MPTSTRRSFTPLYFQIEQDLLRLIDSGELKPGDQLPSEAQLSLKYSVSRITARRALEDLSQQGIVYSHQGVGSFVAQTRIREMSGFRSFSEDIQARGLKPSSRVVELAESDPDAETIRRLALAPGERVYRLHRVRLADEQPVADEIAFLPVRLFPGLDQYDFTRESLYGVFRQQYKIFPTWADAEIEAAPASVELAQSLTIQVGEPVLVALRLTYTASFEVIELVRSVYRGNRFTFFTGRQFIG